MSSVHEPVPLNVGQTTVAMRHPFMTTGAQGKGVHVEASKWLEIPTKDSHVEGF